MVAPFLRQSLIPIPPQSTLTTDETTIVTRAPFNGTITRVAYVAETAITGVNTNNRRFSLINRGQTGAGNVEVAFLEAAAGVNFAAGDERDLTLTATVANRDVVAGDILAFLSDAQGTGMADPGGLLVVEINRSTVGS